jgi:peptidoglycan-associated lipoprotein
MNLRMVLLAGSLAMAGLGLGGCATKDFVRESVAAEDQRVGAVDQRVGAVDQRMGRLDSRVGTVEGTARDALERATAAGKLAEGKLLYSVVLSDDSMKFPVNKATLSAEATERLDTFVAKLKSENRNVYIEVQGHTDASGAKEHNYKLGEERAESVRRYLNQHGIALNRIGAISYGPDAPVGDNHTREGRQANRRVVLIVLN